MDEELYDPECYACERAQEDYRKLERAAEGGPLDAVVRRHKAE